MVLAVVVLGRQRRRLLTEKKTSRRRQLRRKKIPPRPPWSTFVLHSRPKLTVQRDEISKMHQFISKN